VDAADGKHYAITASDASRWVKAIPKYASIEHPTDNLRIAFIKRANSMRPETSITTSTSSQGNIHQHFNLGFPYGSGHLGHSGQGLYNGFGPQNNTPERDFRLRMPSTSPAHSNPEGHVEVDRYFEWLTAKFPGDREKLIRAKDELHGRDIDLKTLRKLPHKELGEWGISWGIADKIRREIKTFQVEDIY
jgi:hypothetical protein